MIIVKLIGGLGNQLFQYSFGRYMAELNSTMLKLDITGFDNYKLHRYALHCFEFNPNIASIDEIVAFRNENKNFINRFFIQTVRNSTIFTNPTLKYYTNTIFIKEKNPLFDSTLLNLRGNLYLEGYWQSEKYFLPIRNTLLKELKVRFEQDSMNSLLANQIRNTSSVSIHIRRGDYVNNQVTQQIHGICTIDYYQNAVKKIVRKISDPHFFIFSDDPDWVIENFKIDFPMSIICNNDASNNYEDLRLMSLCKNNIIANSSFSWWAAWLNTNPDKLVMVPEKWYTDPKINTYDLIPKGWEKA